jgi:sterol desaturase/sphingolipid hydroxylase (fatty acid hydroxylase superfamily)
MRENEPGTLATPDLCMRNKSKNGSLWTLFALGAFIALTWLERRRPLRIEVESKFGRQRRNLAIAALGAASLQLAGAPLIRRLTHYVARHRCGLLQRISAPRWLKVSLALLLMDYTFYVWHVLAHRVPLIWRFHLVHHIDRDLDASTALRFHFGELLAGIPWQAGQVLLFGLDSRAYSIWQATFLLSIMFHHSAVNLPIEWERRLSRFLVTPRMHGIHHSMIEEEMNSNWSSGLNIWDRLHWTLRLNVPQNALRIGVPAYQDPSAAGLSKMVQLPFRRLPSVWSFPDQSLPGQHEETFARDCLLP